MMRLLVDEDMPRSTAPALRAAGFDAVDVRDVGLRAHPDLEIFAHAQATSRAIVTADVGFANVLTFPLGSHFGIIVMRVPNIISTGTVNSTLLNALRVLAAEDMIGALMIVELDRVRLRRPM
jgi:predicted nuclease of predicted toxin-antitoxin system